MDNEIGWGVYGYKGYSPVPLKMSGALPKDKLAKNQTTGEHLSTAQKGL